MIIEQLKEIKSNRKLASIYTNKNDTGRFIVGYIEEISEDFIIIQAVNPNGHFDGLLLKELESIYRVETEGNYLDKMQKLLDYNNEATEQVTLDGKDLITSLLQYAEKNKYVVSIELLNSGFDDIIGYVQRISENGCLINQITTDGQYDGNSTIDYSSISKISCNSEDEKIPGILWFLQNK